MDILTRVEDAAERLKDKAFSFMLNDQAYVGCPCSLDRDERPTEQPIGVAVDVLDEDGDPVRIGVWHDDAAARIAIDSICRRDGVRSWSVLDGTRTPHADLADDAVEAAEIEQDAHIRRLGIAA